MNDRVHRQLTRVGLETALAKRYPHQLSVGQCQRACIARALKSNPKLLLCDEPTSALDAASKTHVIDLFQTLSRSLTLVICTHDLTLVPRFAKQLIVLDRGKIIESGLVTSIFQAPQAEQTRRLLNVPDPEFQGRIAR